jgi:parvulin-like peptidyl-prolyl isomerase
MEMKTRLPFLLVSLVLVAVLAACGGGGNSGPVPADAVARVGSTTITKASLNALIDYAFARAKAQGQTPPKVGTPAYTQLRDQAVTYLVNQEEFQEEGKKIGVTVTQQDVEHQVAVSKKTYFKGSEKKLEAALKKDGITLAQLEQYNIKPNLLTQRLQAKVTSSVKVSNADALKYYKANKSSFSTPAQVTRSVRHILVSSKSQADQLETKLQNGANFAVLAKKYSKDTGSAQNGGKLTAVKGQLVKPFQDVAFSLKTGKVSAPVHSQFGWHIIQALGPVKNTPAHTQTFKEVESQIKANLAQQQQSVAWQNWTAKVAKDFKGKVTYQSGYAPATTTTPMTPAPTTTG